jgi:hypothetical protein
MFFWSAWRQSYITRISLMLLKKKLETQRMKDLFASNENSVPLWDMTLGNQLPML